jgi:hypothetical protein
MSPTAIPRLLFVENETLVRSLGRSGSAELGALKVRAIQVSSLIRAFWLKHRQCEAEEDEFGALPLPESPLGSKNTYIPTQAAPAHIDTETRPYWNATNCNRDNLHLLTARQALCEFWHVYIKVCCVSALPHCP